MHIRLMAVGDRQPAWVDEAFRIYTERLPRDWGFSLHAMATAKRSRKQAATKPVELESERVLDKLSNDEQLILLDECGVQLSSPSLASKLGDWQSDGRDICFLIGGPDGVSAKCRKRADFVWSLSSLTLPHGLARVLFAEQLYRAWSLQSGHPYHRE